MKFVALCNSGFEEICKQELLELIPKATKIAVEDELLFFSCSKEDIIEYIYRVQSVKCVLSYIASCTGTDEKTILALIKKSDFSWIDGSFAARGESSAQEKTIGSVIYDALENPSVDLKEPDYEILTYTTEKTTVVGIDLTGDLSKRSYKIFPHAESVKGTLAYFLVRMSGYKGSGIFLDPCAGSGTLCTEAAFLASSISPRYYDKRDLCTSNFFSDVEPKQIMKTYDASVKKRKDITIQGYDVHLPSVNAMKKNFKIAGVEQYISSGRGDIDWLETKFKEGTVDYIACNPPLYSKYNAKRMDKFYDILFYQCEFILAKKGSMIVLTNNERIPEFAKKYKLKHSLEKEFFIGKAKRYIFSFRH